MMAVKKIVLVPDPILRKKSKPVPKITGNILKLLDNMADTMYDAGGVGLAAPQIGILKRVIVIDTREEDGPGLIEMINPEILEAKGSQTGPEGCLSIPGINGEVERRSYVKVKGLDRNGNEQIIEAENFLATVFQHEIDHLEGILFTDKAKTIYKVEQNNDEEQQNE